jgi:uncharacterized protein (UPF0335 family)
MHANDLIKSFVERVERLNEEIKSLNDDKRDIFAEAKSQGFEVKALKVVIQRRAKDPNELIELQAVVETYEAALGTGNATRAGAGGLDKAMAESKRVSQKTTDERMKAHANLSQELANVGMISPEAAAENTRIAAAMIRKFGTGDTDGLDIPEFLDRRETRQ